MGEFDLVVIGGGPGGYAAALRAAALGAGVALIEKRHPGGTCLNCGCIPTKTYLETAQRLADIQAAEEFGIKANAPELDLDAVRSRKQRVVEELRGGVEGLLSARGVELIRGTGALGGPGRVTVDSKDSLSADKIILATGSSALIPGFLSGAGGALMDSEKALELEGVPERLLVVGGGMVGVEMASIYQAFGSQVTLVEALPRLLPTEEPAVGELLKETLSGRGIQVIVDTGVREVSPKDGGVEAWLQDGTRHQADRLLAAVGRRPNAEGLGLDQVGIHTDGGRVKVDETMRTNSAAVYAIGDLIGAPMLAHVASAEGEVAASHALGESRRINYSVIPYCAYTHPEVARVGLTEEEARARHADILVGEFPGEYSGRAKSMGETGGFVKLLACAETKEILGATLVGPAATELIHELAVAVHNELTLECLAETIHAHPTLSEMIAEASLHALGTPVHRL